MREKIKLQNVEGTLFDTYVVIEVDRNKRQYKLALTINEAKCLWDILDSWDERGKLDKVKE